MGHGPGGWRVDGGQVRAARVLLGWTQAALARESGIGLATVKRLEADVDDVGAASLGTVVRALEAAGVAFLSPGAEIAGMAGSRVRRGVALIDRL